MLASAERYRIFPPNNDWVNREVDILWNPYRDLPVYALGPPAPFSVPRQASIDGRQISVTSSPTDGRDYIDAGAGNDTIFAGGGDDFVLGGAGDDYIDPGTGHDTISGGAGRDYIVSWFGDSVGDDIDGGDGDDFIVDMASEGNRIDGGAGNDYLQSGAGTDTILGGEGNDRIFSFGGDDALLGGAGNDELRYGGSGHAFLAGGAGDDRLVAMIQNYGGSATFAWARGDGNDRGIVVGGSGTLEVGGLPGEVSVQYVTGVPSGEQLVEGQPEALGSGFRFTWDGDADSFTLLELPDSFYRTDLQVRFADGTTWDDAYLRSLAAPPGAPVELVALAGTSDADVVYGSDGDDRFASSGGNDWLLGGGGNDVYEYALGDGFDQIEDSGGDSDTLQFAAGIGSGDVNVFAVGPDYVLEAGAGGTRIRGGRTADGAIERVDFADGTHWTPADLEARAELLPDNRAPLMAPSMGSVSVDPGAHVEVSIPRDAISDPDRFDALSVYAITAEGELLPDWVSFDSSALKFSASPGAGDAGAHELLLIAADSSGAATVSSLTINVGGDGAAPPPGQPAPDPVDSPSMVPASPDLSSAASARPAPSPAAPAESAAAADIANLPPVVTTRHEEPAFTESPPLRLADVARIIPDPVEPLQRDMQQQFDQLLQTGRANLGERYAEAIREFEERRRQREAPQESPPPTDEEIEAWNSAMHDWHDRNPGFAETELGGNDGTWGMGWGLPGAGGQSLGANGSSSTLLDIANPAALPRLDGAAARPALDEGLRNLR